jgi:hypothetical protein
MIAVSKRHHATPAIPITHTIPNQNSSFIAITLQQKIFLDKKIHHF